MQHHSPMPPASGHGAGKCSKQQSLRSKRPSQGVEQQARVLPCEAVSGTSSRVAVHNKPRQGRGRQHVQHDVHTLETLLTSRVGQPCSPGVEHLDEEDTLPSYSLETMPLQSGRMSAVQAAVSSHTAQHTANHVKPSTARHHVSLPVSDTTQATPQPQRRRRDAHRSHRTLRNPADKPVHSASRSSQQQQQQQGEGTPAGAQQGKGQSDMSPRALTGILSKSKTLADIQRHLQRHARSFNHLHVACAMNRLAKCQEAEARTSMDQVHKAMDTLEQLFVQNLPKYTAREVTNALWCWARTAYKCRASTRQLLTTAITQDGGAMLQHSACTPQTLANLCWAVTSLVWTDEQLWAILDRVILSAVRQHWQVAQQQPGSKAQRDPRQFLPVDTASLAFSLSSANRTSLTLYQKVIAVAESQLEDFKPQDLCNVLWGCANIKYTPELLFRKAIPIVQACLTGYTSQGLCNTAWAYAAANVHDPQLFAAITKEAAARHPSSFESRHWAQIVWGMVRAKQVHEEVVKRAVTSALTEPDQWVTPNLSRLMYALVVGDMGKTFPLDRFAATLRQRMQRAVAGDPAAAFRFQDVSQVVWSCAVAGVYDEQLYQCAKQLCMANREEWMAHSASFQSILWSFGLAGHYDEALFEVGAEYLSRLPPHVDDITALQLPNVAGILVPMAQVQHRDTAACAAVAAHFAAACQEQPSRVSGPTLLTVLWSLMLLNYVDEPLLRAAFGLLSERWPQQMLTMQESPTAWGMDGSQLSDVDGEVEAADSSRGRVIDCVGEGDSVMQVTLHPVLGRRMVAPFTTDYLYSKQLAQIFQMTMWLEDELGEAGRALVREWIPESMYSVASKVWKAYASKVINVSGFQTQVLQTLQAMGLKCRVEQLTVDGCFSLDAVLYIGDYVVSVETNGPGHYTRTQPQRMLGSKVLRDRFVQARGHYILNVPYWDWDNLSPIKAQRYLYTRLLEVMGPDTAHLLAQYNPDRQGDKE